MCVIRVVDPCRTKVYEALATVEATPFDEKIYSQSRGSLTETRRNDILVSQSDFCCVLKTWDYSSGRTFVVVEVGVGERV